MSEFKLTKSQQRCFDLIEGTQENYFLFGKPGVGKSVLINHLIQNGNKDYTIAAPTGLAALNVNGRTLHSIFRIPVSLGIIHPDYNAYTEDDKALAFIRYQIRTLVIDEVSMVRVDIFDYIDRLLRHVKKVNMPFGGVQVILVGDFFQLPPVATNGDLKELKEAGYKSPFIFSSKIFQENFRTLLLTEVLRQKGDPKFVKVLDSARIGHMKDAELKPLNARVETPNDIRIKLCSTNKEADQINFGHLRAIAGEATIFSAEVFGEWPAYPVDRELQIKVGAQVMVRMNKADRHPKQRGEFISKVVNGTLGIVEAIKDTPDIDKMNLQLMKDMVGDGLQIHDYVEDDTDFHPYVVIRTEDGNTHNIYMKRWERKRKVRTGDGWEEQLLAAFEQIPLSLAWAISIHKSQGQSFDKVHIDPTRIFAAGQLYVALSRCRSLAGITLQTPVTKNKFWADLEVKRFYFDVEEQLTIM